MRRIWKSGLGRRPSPDTRSFAEPAPAGWRQRLSSPRRLRRRTEPGGPDGAPLGGECCSLPPCNGSVDVALDSNQRFRISTVLRVVRLQQVLSNHGELKVVATTPAQPEVRRLVARDSLRRQIADVSIGLTKLQASR